MLNEIVEKTKERIEQSKEIIPLEDLKKEVELLEITVEFPFKKALMSRGGRKYTIGRLCCGRASRASHRTVCRESNTSYVDPPKKNKL